MDASSRDAIQGPELFDFDHVHFDSKAGSPVAVLYGAVGTDCFKKFHLSLAKAAKEVSLFSLGNFSFIVEKRILLLG